MGFPADYDCCYDPKCATGSGGTACCTSSNQCGEGEGDCDSDIECIGSLKCGQGNGFDDNCGSGFPYNYDCCYDPAKINCADGSGGASCCSSSNQCVAGEGDCDYDSHCIGNLKCGQDNCDTSLGFPGNYDCCYEPSCSDGSGGTACCTSSNQCGLGEGDCDSDIECIGSLKCGINNCDSSLGFPGNYDCCYGPNCADGTGGAACCTSSNQCGSGEGDCDSDSDCIGSLKCGSNNCDTSLGFPPDYDCCYDTTPCIVDSPNSFPSNPCYTVLGSGCDKGSSTWSSWSCCSISNQCDIGEGDCDIDSQCSGNLKCGTDNCGANFPTGFDCCIVP